MNHPGNWSILPRAALLTLISVCCAGAGLVLHAQPLRDLRSAHAHRLQSLKAEVQDALRRSAALPMLQARSQQLAARLQSATAQGRGDADGAALQLSLSTAAEQCGLSLQAFRPREDGAELGVVGDYPALLRFVADVSQFPHALLFESLDISAQRTAARHRLLMKASVRYQALSAATNQEPAHP